jgi:protein-disulfide isomerase
MFIIQESWLKRYWPVLLATVTLLSGLACVLPSLPWAATPTPTARPATPTETINLPPHPSYSVQADRNTLGDPAAPVHIDIWEDFQCPACAYYSINVEPQIIQKYVASGQALYTYHFFAFLDGGHPNGESHQAANAALCAAEQGKFWEYHALLVANWNGENQGAFRNARLFDFARFLALNEDDFGVCFRAQRYADQIRADYELGLQWGVQGTPSLFVNGVIVTPGYVPSLEAVTEAVEAALAR